MTPRVSQLAISHRTRDEATHIAAHRQRKWPPCQRENRLEWSSMSAVPEPEQQQCKVRPGGAPLPGPRQGTHTCSGWALSRRQRKPDPHLNSRSLPRILLQSWDPENTAHTAVRRPSRLKVLTPFVAAQFWPASAHRLRAPSTCYVTTFLGSPRNYSKEHRPDETRSCPPVSRGSS